MMNIASARDAGKKAVEILTELIPEAKYAALEGIESDDATNSWNVIVGYMLSSDIPQTTLDVLRSNQNRRTYKVLVLDKSTLELNKMEPYHVNA